MRISLEIVTKIDFDFVPENYPRGFTAEQALALELKQANQYPQEYLVAPEAWTRVEGRLLGEPRQPANGRPLSPERCTRTDHLVGFQSNVR